MDARDQLIDGLASQMGIDVLDQPDGSRNISLKSGQPLVIGSLAGTLTSSMTNTGEQTLSLDFAKSSYTLDLSPSAARWAAWANSRKIP